MTDSPIASWSEAFTALRRPDSRNYAALVLAMAAVLYATCLFGIAVIVVLAGCNAGSDLVRLAVVVAAGFLLPLVWDRVASRILWGWSQTLWRRPPSGPDAWSADARDLLDLYAMDGGPRDLGDFVLSLIPYSKPPSWWHPWRRIRASAADGRRVSELVAEADSLAKAGLLRQVERGHGWNSLGVYEVTDAGRAACEAPCGLTEGAA